MLAERCRSDGECGWSAAGMDRRHRDHEAHPVSRRHLATAPRIAGQAKAGIAALISEMPAEYLRASMQQSQLRRPHGMSKYGRTVLNGRPSPVTQRDARDLAAV